MLYFFFFQAEDGIRDIGVTGVQTCALPISESKTPPRLPPRPQSRQLPRLPPPRHDPHPREVILRSVPDPTGSGSDLNLSRDPTLAVEPACYEEHRCWFEEAAGGTLAAVEVAGDGSAVGAVGAGFVGSGRAVSLSRPGPVSGAGLFGGVPVRAFRP